MQKDSTMYYASKGSSKTSMFEQMNIQNIYFKWTHIPSTTQQYILALVFT